MLRPIEIGGFFGNAGSDLSDAWISYDSDQPIFVWGSIVDNGSEDPTFVPAFEDTGVAPPAPQLTTMTIVAEDFRFVRHAERPLKAGEQVQFILSKANGSAAHGIRITDSSFNDILDVDLSYDAGRTDRHAADVGNVFLRLHEQPVRQRQRRALRHDRRFHGR